jgi:adenine-specific DNA-methyltransferase
VTGERTERTGQGWLHGRHGAGGPPLGRYDAPDTYGVARKRIDCRARQSAFNSKLKFAPQLRALIAAITARYVLVSFSDEGFVTREQLIEWLSAQGKLTITTVSYPRYVGAKIGIHDPQGRKVGKVGRLRNLEQVFALDRQGRPGDVLERVAAPIESR